MRYETEHIKMLFNCEKEIIDPPTKDYKEDRGHMKKNFTLQSLNKEYLFRGFIRFSTKFHENFSVGLDYNPKKGLQDGVATSLDDVKFLAKTLLEFGYDNDKRLCLLDPPYIKESKHGLGLRQRKIETLRDFSNLH